MDPSIKPIVEALLQAAVDGKLTDVPSMLDILDPFTPFDGFEIDTLLAITEFTIEFVECTTIPCAKAFAEKYNLTLRL